MNSQVRFLLINIFFIFLVIPGISAQEDARINDWWHMRYPATLGLTEANATMSKISVKGNKFINESGDVVFFRGMSVADPDKVEQNGQWNKGYFEQVKKWNVNLVRIPVHPIAWRNRGIDGYLSLLDDAVKWCSELGIYIIIDWHSIGNLCLELFQDPMYETNKPETYNFWRIMAKRYKNINSVAFFEIFNEPTIFRGILGHCSWQEWKTICENAIDIIYAENKSVIPLVAGFDWAYDLTPLRMAPISREGIAYVTHPYPQKRMPPYAEKWEEDFGFAANKYPVIATELGFTLGRMSVKENGHYGNEIINYLETKGISWVIWVFDPEWYPQLIKNWEFEPTEYGDFFLKHLNKN